MTWDALAATSTAAASIIALVTIWVTQRNRHDEKAAEGAAPLREDARTFAHAAERVAGAITDGSILIVSSWRAVRQIGSLAGDEMKPSALRRHLVPGGLGLSGAVVGWAEAADAHHLQANLDLMSGAGSRLAGELSLLPASGEILEAIVDDVYSIFLKQLSESPFLEMTLESVSDAETVPEFIAELGATLHGTTAAYVVKRYASVLKHLVDLIQAEAEVIAGLESARLVALSHRKVQISFERTRTSELRARIDRLEGEISASDRARVVGLVADLEQALADSKHVAA